MKTKRCSRCGEVKPVSKFYKKKTSSDGLHSACKPCHIEIAVRTRDLVIAEIEEKDNRNKEPNRFIKDTVKEIYAKGGIKLITDHVEELRSVISEYYNRIASLEEAMSKAIKLNDIYNIGYVVRLLQTALDKKEASK